MPVLCPNCREVLDQVNDAHELGSAATRFFCSECQIAFERDAAGTLQELES